MLRTVLYLLILLIPVVASAQSAYHDSTSAYLKRYVEQHEVVTGEDKKRMHFYPVNEKYRVHAKFETVNGGGWFTMPTSGRINKVFRVFGKIHFTIHDTAIVMNLYQSQQLMSIEKYRDNLFLPFTDLTSGEETYVSGRYIDLNLNDIRGNVIEVDFNKAYNPYCAYVSDKYNCPIPPKENHLNVAVLAGEKNYKK